MIYMAESTEDIIWGSRLSGSEARFTVSMSMLVEAAAVDAAGAAAVEAASVDAFLLQPAKTTAAQASAKSTFFIYV
jgi:hypothetical protein